MRDRVAPAFAAVMITLIAVRALLADGIAVDGLYAAVELLTATAVAVAVRLHRPEHPGPWRLIATSLALSGLVSTAWTAVAAAGVDPTVVSPVYLLAYGCGLAGLWQFIRVRSPHAGVPALLDTAIVTTGVTVLLWVLVIHPAWQAAEGAAEPRLIVVIYPLLSLVMLALAARLAFGGGRANTSLRWMGVGVTLYLVTQTAVLVPWVDGPFETLRLIATVTIGLAALQPSMRLLTEPAPSSDHRLAGWRLAALWAASVAAPLTLLVAVRGEHAGPLGVIALGSITLFSLVVARMWGLLLTVRAVLGRQHEDRFRALIEHADDVVLIVHPEDGLTYVSPSVERRWGYTIERMRELELDLVAPEDRHRLLEVLRDVTASPAGTVAPWEGRALHADGGWRHLAATLTNHVDDPAIAGLVVTCRDVTTQRELEVQLSHQAFHDPLTGLPNRALFTDRVVQALDGRDHDHFTAVLFLDLDDFKTINDGLGHDVGDDLLRIVGQRLAQVVRPEDTVARFGGDEFAILVPRTRTIDTVTALADRLRAALADPVSLAHRRVEAGVSIGIATSHDAPNADALLRDAEAAMYAAKRDGQATFHLFDPTMHANAVRRLQLKMDLHKAAERGELTVVYQTIHDVASADVVGVEALLRWHHPLRGPIRPDEFIPLAEETGSIEVIGTFVLEQACAEVARYRGLTGRDVYLTVNVSPVQLEGPGLARTVAGALERTGLPAHRLVLELTESVFIADDETVAGTLHAIAELGVLLAIDDFGTGYCSLAYLERFRFDIVKVDKAFIDVLDDATGDARLTVGILELISSLGVPAVAEGIETALQLEVLRAIGCPYGQGYHWSRPVPIHELPITATVSSAVR
ncbi:putative bifunctional diguanylate cyclase/phosphodiesterase [Nitriliruptor alkaliphilus]|uniref:putative bifunctional diguanylate cyclase/phosphodiesterase n=1 Tax=Nitriliruptor alkaliphilus TaxID=427918 RepID=UPI0006960D11|nr:bifunctional diguanylate cyclase/phosphodiesterase [Nitriliruptor alkaliphilus]